MKNKTPLSISINQKLLKNIEENISGKSRSEKIANCAEAGYHKIMRLKASFKQHGGVGIPIERDISDEKWAEECFQKALEDLLKGKKPTPKKSKPASHKKTWLEHAEDVKV